jgi:hypothetical protein
LANALALAVVGAVLNLRRSHPSAPAIDALDMVMKGRQGHTLDFVEARVRHACRADPAIDFGHIVAAALDHAMTLAEWVAFTGDQADPLLSDACLGVWRAEIFGLRFCGSDGVTVQGPP